MPTSHIPRSLRDDVRQRAQNRCEYCQTPEWLIGLAHEIDHIVPRAGGGESKNENLCLACSACNGFKHAKMHGIDRETGEEVPLFHPRRHRWHEHFAWDADGVRIIGLTPTGRVTIEALQLNHTLSVTARTIWAGFGYHPPEQNL